MQSNPAILIVDGACSDAAGELLGVIFCWSELLSRLHVLEKELRH